MQRIVAGVITRPMLAVRTERMGHGRLCRTPSRAEASIGRVGSDPARNTTPRTINLDNTPAPFATLGKLGLRFHYCCAHFLFAQVLSLEPNPPALELPTRPFIVFDP
jgi:hypothetical protein